MDWKYLLQNLGIFSIGTLSLSGLLYFLIKSIIKHFLNKDIEKFKSLANLAIEKYKSEMQLESEKNKIQYSLLQEKRALVVSKLYSLLDAFHRSIIDLMAPFQPAGTLSEKEKAMIAAADANKFRDYYTGHKIYFDGDTCKLIEDMNEKFRKAWIDFQFKDKIHTEKIEDDLWIKSWKTVDEEIPIIRRKIENVFRNILGIKN